MISSASLRRYMSAVSSIQVVGVVCVLVPNARKLKFVKNDEVGYLTSFLTIFLLSIFLPHLLYDCWIFFCCFLLTWNFVVSFSIGTFHWLSQIQHPFALFIALHILLLALVNYTSPVVLERIMQACFFFSFTTIAIDINPVSASYIAQVGRWGKFIVVFDALLNCFNLFDFYYYGSRLSFGSIDNRWCYNL